MKVKKYFCSFGIFLAVSSSTHVPAQQSQLFGPASGAGIVREISHNGRYVVGQASGSAGSVPGYIWDTQSGNTLTLFPTSSEALGVTDAGFAVGSYTDTSVTIDGNNVRTGGYVEPGTTSWVSLGYGLVKPPITNLLDGTFARRINAGGTVIIGNSAKYLTANNKITVPYSWTKNATGEWIGEAWAFPAGAEQCALIDVADNGQTAAGYFHNGSTRQAILWKSKNEFILPLGNSAADYHEFLCISANGKYAGFRGASPGIYNLETQEITYIPEAFLVNDITDNGLAVGIYRSSESVDKAFVWSEILGFMDLADFIKLYTGFNPGNLYLTSANRSSINAVTPDGLNFAIQVTTTAMPRQALAYVLRFDTPIGIFPYPKNLTATIDLTKRNEVTLHWEAPLEVNTPITGYVIYRNTTAIDTTGAGTTTYINSNVPNGYYTYKVRALFGMDGAGKSNVSNGADVVIQDNFNLPLRETFNSLNLKTNYWTTSIEEPESVMPHLSWKVYNDAGAGSEQPYGLQLEIHNFDGEADQAYSATLQSKFLDGRTAQNIYISYLVKADYYLESTLTPDTIFTDVFDGEQWVNVNKAVLSLVMGWRAEIIDASPVAAGKFFQVRFRVVGENKTVSAKYINFDDITIAKTAPNGAAVPLHPVAVQQNGSLLVAWQHPSTGMYGLTYADCDKRYSLGNEGVPFIAVNRFDSKDLVVYQGKYLRSITAYINQKVANPSVITRLNLAVYENGERIADQPVYGYTANDWNTFELNEPVLINGQELKFGVEVAGHDAKEEPVGADGLRNTVTGKGDLYWDGNDEKWHTLTEAGFVNNWCIIGNVSDGLSTSSMAWSNNIVGYNVYLDGLRLNDYLLFKQHYLIPETAGRITVRAYSAVTGLSGEAAVEHEVAILKPENTLASCYPNPVQDVLHLNSNSGILSFSACDISGRKIEFIANPNHSIDTKNWNKGVYLIKVTTKNGESIYKIIKN